MKKTIFVITLLGLKVSQIVSQHSLGYKNDIVFNKVKFSNIIVIGTFGYVSAMTFLNFDLWHKDDERVAFHFYNDNSGYLQMDKFKHAYGSYFEGYIGYNLLKIEGFSKSKALLYGGSIGFFIQSPKEILDGLYKPGGFSWGDVLANATGSALLIGQELLFNEQVIRYKFSYSRSQYAKYSNGYLGSTWLQSYYGDYNGHTYWFSINANRLFLKKILPPWINLAAGYSANGMFGELNNIDSYNGVAIPPTQRYRQFLFSLDVDWTKINTRSNFLKILLQGLDFIKIPFPAVEFNSLGRLKGYWLYF